MRVNSGTKSLEPFRRDKIFVSLLSSMSHKETALTDSGSLTATVIDTVLPMNQNGLISSRDIARVCATVLKNFDRAAFAYYEAHYIN